jgi:secreted PhoX family phosphatase
MTDAFSSHWPAFVRNDKGGRSRRTCAARCAAAVDGDRPPPAADGGNSAGGDDFPRGQSAAASAPRPFAFDEIAAIATPHDRLPAGYTRQIVVRWGDPMFADAPAFDFRAQSPARAQRQFGFNNDYTAFMPLPFGSGRSDHGLLIVNHEYPLPQLMFAGSDGRPSPRRSAASRSISASRRAVTRSSRSASAMRMADRSCQPL